MNLTQEERRKKLAIYAQNLPINDFPGLTAITTQENTIFHSSKTYYEMIGCKSEDQAHDLAFENYPSSISACHEQFSDHCQDGHKNKKLIRVITYGNMDGNGWKVFVGHQNPIIDKESNDAIGIMCNYLDITENSFFDIGRLILMEKDGLKRKQFQYRIQENQGFEGLSKREQEVLFWYNHGVNSIGISRRLSKPDRSITPSTVRSYLEKIKLKLGVTNKEQLLEKSISIGFMCTVPESLFVD